MPAEPVERQLRRVHGARGASRGEREPGDGRGEFFEQRDGGEFDHGEWWWWWGGECDERGVVVVERVGGVADVEFAAAAGAEEVAGGEWGGRGGRGGDEGEYGGVGGGGVGGGVCELREGEGRWWETVAG